MLKLIKKTFKEWRKDNAQMFAAALTYYTLFSLMPLLIIAIAIVGYVFGEQAVQGRIVDQIQLYVGKEGARVIEVLVQNAQFGTSSIIFTIIGIILLAYGATRVFVHLKNALNIIWGVETKKHVRYVLKSRLLSVVMVLIIIFLLILSLVMSSILAAVGFILAQFLPFYVFFLQFLNYAVSFGMFGIGSIYGVAGTLIILLIWFYYSALIFFFGAEFTEVYATEYGTYKKKGIKKSGR